MTVHEGAAIGARSVCIAPVQIGAWSIVAAGAVVARDVPAFALVAGVPARFVRWIGRTGAALEADGPATWRCPETGDRFHETDGVLSLIDG